MPTSGSSTIVPTRSRYRSSSGFTATATSPGIVSGRVVATVIDPLRSVRRRVRHVVELPVRLARLGLFVAQRREAARTPVDHAVSAIDRALRRTGARTLRAPRARARARTCTRCATSRTSCRSRAAARESSPPVSATNSVDALEKARASEVEARLALLRDDALDHVLRGDARVIGARHPERFVLRHAAPAHEHVLHGVVEAVPHVQHRRHVRRRDHDRERARDRRLRARSATHSR